jgi:bifunctional DNA-binding transcriptional regulator/antitoxin component of YhaV-PrlF toxin-antitoxin module
MIQRVTSTGQVELPRVVREQAGIDPDSDVDVSVIAGVVQIRPAARSPSAGQRLVQHLLSCGVKPVMTADELMALTRGEDDGSLCI